MYAITGITGQVGGQVAEALLARAQPVRAVLRDAAKAPAWRARGCEVAVAAMDDAAALRGAFDGAAGVFVLLPPVFDPDPAYTHTRAHIDALSDALASARPGRVVALSTIGAQATQPNLLNQLGWMEHALAELTMPVAFLRAAWFVENIAWDIAQARDAGTIASFLQPTGRAVPMVATADVARRAAQLLRDSWHGQRVVELEGPQRVSPDAIAQTLARLLGRPVRADAVPRAQWETLFRAQGMQHPGPRMRMLDGFNEGWIEFERGAAESEKGETAVETVLRGLLARSTAAAVPAA